MNSWPKHGGFLAGSEWLCNFQTPRGRMVSVFGYAQVLYQLQELQVFVWRLILHLIYYYYNLL